MSALERRVERLEQRRSIQNSDEPDPADLCILRIQRALREPDPDYEDEIDPAVAAAELEAALAEAATYDYPPLNELAAFVTEHGRLPDYTEWQIPRSAIDALFHNAPPLADLLRELNQRRGTARMARKAHEQANPAG